ncbi:DNA-dependent ATPase mgs1 [Collariella sp. IMI 366227]|nr:DNA-dependent ATPase mgs1 [Collariella sp. IMI 366227]
MNAPSLLSRRAASVCLSCRRNLLRQRHFSTTPRSLVAAFQAYSLPSHPPPTPRNAAAPDTSITHPIQSPSFPRVHETRPPKTADTPTPAPASIPEQVAQHSKPDFAAAPASPQSPSPASAQQPTPAPTTQAPAKSAPRVRPKLRARKAAMKLTPTAVEHLRALLDQPDPKLIKVGVRNRGCSGLAYHLEYVDKAGAFDEAVEQDGVKVLIDSKALFSIIGSEMDWVEDKLSQRFVFRNPNITIFAMVVCPICNRAVHAAQINSHIDSGCQSHILDEPSSSSPPNATQSTQNHPPSSTQKKRSASTFFQTPAAKRQGLTTARIAVAQPNGNGGTKAGVKRGYDEGPGSNSAPIDTRTRTNGDQAEILWGGSGTGKTTIARCIARRVGSRFIELNATSTGVGECKKLFAEAANELGLTGRRTIIFCDEIHRFNKAQQDVFLKPVEAGTITLIGATTENPSFRVQSALLSRCRTFTLQSLTEEDLQRILLRALEQEVTHEGLELSPLIDQDLLRYLSAFADGDARTALNLLELTLSLTNRPVSLTTPTPNQRIPQSRSHKDSTFHKSVRGSDSDAALYYLARMLQSGEDPLFIARRMVVIASEDVGLADNSLLPLATATYTATQQIGMPEARIPLAHCAVALCLAPKSTRAYRGLNNALSALQEPGVAGLPVPVHLRNAPTRLMREMGYGKEYKYPPNYREGRVRQDYLPEGLVGRRFLEERDLGTEVDPDVEMAV